VDFTDEDRQRNWGQNYEKLVSLKKKYDPGCMFRPLLAF